MTYFNKKFDVLDIQLSPYGRHLLQNGQLMPKYYAFFDDDVIYDSQAANFSEKNSDIKNRIMNETPVLRPHYLFKSIESTIDNDQPFPTAQYDSVKRPIADETSKFLQYSLGSSDPTKEKAPAWNVYCLINEITGAAMQLSSSQYQPLNIAQLDFNIDYEMSIQNVSNNIPSSGLKGTPNLPLSEVFDDGTYVNLDEEQIILLMLEKNGFLFGDSLEVEVFMYETTGSGDSLTFTENLKPLKFLKREKQILNDIMVVGEPQPVGFRTAGEQITPQHVEYYWDCRLDKEIPLDDLCKGINQLKATGLAVDELLDIECPDEPDLLDTSIYTSKVTSIEDCD